MIFYGFDPGGTTGYCKVEIRERIFRPLSVEELSFDQTLEWCESIIEIGTLEPSMIVCEDYIINPKVQNYSHQGDRGVPMQLIGALKLTALATGMDLFLSPNTNKPAGYGYLGGQYKRGSQGRHIQDSLAHVMWYAVQQRIVDIAVPQKEPLPPVQKRSAPRIHRTPPDGRWHHKGTQSS